MSSAPFALVASGIELRMMAIATRFCSKGESALNSLGDVVKYPPRSVD